MTLRPFDPIPWKGDNAKIAIAMALTLARDENPIVQALAVFQLASGARCGAGLRQRAYRAARFRKPLC
jgi:hypothetical protein